MFFLNQKKAKITSFEIRGDKLLYLSDKNLYVDSILLREQDVCCFVRGLKERIIFCSWDSVIYTFKNNKTISLLECYSLSEKKYSEDKIIISQRVSRGVFNKFVFDLSTGSILKKIDAEPSFISLSSEIFTIATTLKSLSLLTGEYEWEVDLGAYGEIAQIIGNFQNQLIVSLSNQNLIGIQVKTGEILWEFRKPQEIRADFTRNAHLDSETGKIYFLTFYDFVEFDIQTYSISQHKSFWTGNFQTTWQFGHSCQQGDYIYFTAGIGTAQFYYWLGVFHIPSMEIVWQYQREDQKETFNSSPQVSEKQLFALDSGGTLHIFEKEQP
ncbi:hypothetical protein [Cellulophaga sp. BC115SP]|uniref:hypothetical protein n=1 Tax=Cellulophaga sp. BC115SP TaxID=2683263 RepID=UPI0014137262|nr:hypothetical protein [Cellulophaga sp. BC115SP]NBB31834.1 hypothetical protein [Cellulophaga sp. BC115SP]